MNLCGCVWTLYSPKEATGEWQRCLACGSCPLVILFNLFGRLKESFLQASEHKYILVFTLPQANTHIILRICQASWCRKILKGTQIQYTSTYWNVKILLAKITSANKIFSTTLCHQLFTKIYKLQSAIERKTSLGFAAVYLTQFRYILKKKKIIPFMIKLLFCFVFLIIFVFNLVFNK